MRASKKKDKWEWRETIEIRYPTGESGSETKARDTGSNTAIKRAGKEYYFEPVTIKPRRPISHLWQELFWKYARVGTMSFKV